LKQIDEECIKVYESKLEAMNLIANRSGREKSKYILISKKDDLEAYLGDIYTFVPVFMNFLWENPKVVALLLMNSKLEDIKSNLANLFINNFYENILSSSFIEDQLLYVLGLMLKNEIDNVIPQKTYFQKFLNETPCGALLEQLRMKQDVQTYFKNIIYKTVEELEEHNSTDEINFNVETLEKEFDLAKKEMENELNKKGKRKKTLNDIYCKNSKEENNTQIDQNVFEEFNSKYAKTFGKEEYKILIEKHQLNKFMSEFLTSQFQLIQKMTDIYSNEKFFKKISEKKNAKEILASYQIDFMKVLKLIDDILKNLLDNLHLLPYSVKVICKMIVLLVKKKFSDSTFLEQNAFMAQFFFHKLFSPIFESPDVNAFINKFIISKETKHNLAIISFIIRQLFSGKFFFSTVEQEDFTPFNWYFVDKFEYVCQFFNMVIKVPLPPFIEKLINDELPKGYLFNYFKENKEEKVLHRSICFNIQDLYVILNNMKNIKELLFTGDETKKLQKTFEKLIHNSSMGIIERMSQYTEIETIKGETKKGKDKIGVTLSKFMLLSDLVSSLKYTKLFNLKKEESNFHLPEVTNNLKVDESKKVNVSKIKNFICILLNNNRSLSLSEFLENYINNIPNILRQMKNNMQISNFVIDGSIPSEWYVDSILEYLKKIPNELTSNDCDVLFRQIEAALNVSIKELDFDALSTVSDNIKYVKGLREYFKKMKNALIDLQLNEKVQNIIDKEPINVEIGFVYDNTTKELKIEKVHKKNFMLKVIDSLVYEDDSGRSYISRNIKGFTKIFPNIEKYHISMTQMDSELKLQVKIANFFKIVQEQLKSKNSSIINLSEQEFNEISSKIYDYVMEKLYDKLFPKEPDQSDIKIHQNCELFSWTEPRHFIKTKTVYVYDSFLPEVINYFKEIENQRSPRQKLFYMNQIFRSISNVVKFNGGNDVGVDDIFPILNYSFIKAKPTRMFSNCKYMELFIGDKKNKEDGSQLTQFLAMCQHIENLTTDKLREFTEEDHQRSESIIQLMGK
jgi:hypothetical protein